MKIVLPGGSGHAGGMLTRAFVRDGHEVVILSRKGAAHPGARVVAWDGQTLTPAWTQELEGADAVINLAGRSVDCRYGASNRRAILDSRVLSTQAIGRAIRQARRPPRVWLQSSTATIYAHRYDAPNDEASGLLGGDEPGAPETWRFSIKVAKAWEAAALETGWLPHTRRLLLRTAIIMSADAGGAFATLLRLVRLGLGGRIGDGKQYVSWIHEADFVRAIYWLIARPDFEGIVNLASPHPVTNDVFMRVLRGAWGSRFGLPAARWMLELGAFFLRTESELVLKSRRVVPARLLEAGFSFQHLSWREAARELCERMRPLKPAVGNAGSR